MVYTLHIEETQGNHKTVKSIYWQQTHKIGIIITKSDPEALDIDKQKDKNIWRDSINEEIPNIDNSVDEYNIYTSNLIGYQKITGHIIFDVKMGEKTTYTADGHKTDMPISINYITVVSWDFIRICLTISVLNGIHVISADVENAYLLVPYCERVWMRARPEFCNHEGKVSIIKKALYGLKSSSIALWAF